MSVPNSLSLPGFLLALVASGMACAEEVIKVPVTERKVAELPKGPAMQGPLPRPVLIVNLEERGEFPGGRTVSSFWTFDPGCPEKGLHKVFTGPGQNQYLRFMTPLFGGYGMADGRLNRENEPGSDVQWFWFNPLEGKTGPTIDVHMSQEWLDGTWFVGEQTIEGKGEESTSKIVRYDPLKATVLTTELDFSYLNWLNKREVLGVAKLKEAEQVILLDVEKSEYKIIGKPRPRLNLTSNRMFSFKISPAGKNACDGIYAVEGFSLYFLPSGGEWHAVIQNVNIVKKFGGAFPWLPVSYLGNSRFAVTKTVKDEVEVPKTTPKNEAMYGAAEAVTMLIDGATGRVIEQSKPFIYNHNPPLKIPDEWWASDLKPKPPEPEAQVKSLFQWDEKQREIRFAGDKVLKLGEEDERSESSDGRYLLVYQKCPRGGGKAKTKVPFRILDGKTGKVHSAEVESDFYEVWVETKWEVLCSESPDPKTLRDFQDSGPGAE